MPGPQFVQAHRHTYQTPARRTSDWRSGGRRIRTPQSVHRVCSVALFELLHWLMRMGDERRVCLSVCQAADCGVVESGVAGSGSDLSEELVVGVEPAALDVRAAPDCPPESVVDVLSLRIICRQTWSASRRSAAHRFVVGLPGGHLGVVVGAAGAAPASGPATRRHWLRPRRRSRRSCADPRVTFPHPRHRVLPHVVNSFAGGDKPLGQMAAQAVGVLHHPAALVPSAHR